jgi:hypothetical protein
VSKFGCSSNRRNLRFANKLACSSRPGTGQLAFQPEKNPLNGPTCGQTASHDLLGYGSHAFDTRAVRAPGSRFALLHCRVPAILILYGSAPIEEILAGIIERKKRLNRMVELRGKVALNVHELENSSFYGRNSSKTSTTWRDR